MSKIFFTSDLHFGHKNILRFDNRPFTSIEEMDEAIIRNWNTKVSDDDLVYVLGDISWHNDETTARIFNSLKGHKILIKGNHDRVHGQVRKCFDEIADYAGFIDQLNSLWESLDDNFELRSEEAYTPTDPISFDELMGVIPNND